MTEKAHSFSEFSYNVARYPSVLSREVTRPNGLSKTQSLLSQGIDVQFHVTLSITTAALFHFCEYFIT
jgi:hypothetical protein